MYTSQMGGLSKTLRKIATGAQAIAVGAATYAQGVEQVKRTVKSAYPNSDYGYEVLPEVVVTPRPVNWWLVGGVSAVGLLLILRNR